MTTTINASTSAGLVQTADTSGALALQTAGTTALSISASQVVTLTNALPVASGGSGVTTSTGTGANVLGTSPTIATPTMTGQATIPTINLTGGQIAFPASQSASSDANTLDDYEEGTWTPTFSPQGGGSIGGSTVGTYVKVGKTVTVYFSVYISSISSASGAGALGGFPFTTNNSSGQGANRAALGLMREDGSTGIPYYFYLNASSTSGVANSASNGSLVWTVGYIYDGMVTYIASA